ncbi:MAG TPA: SUF system Fe-S cluster assembly regulator [Candidatus Acidoferrales bacterium]|nr:SUF system Fe-S cluster assembly regulator [Candidatus Acidoferrales bacterium]
MVRLSKLTDYGMVLMSCFARSPAGALRTARDLAAESRLPLPTVSKVLKELLQSGLLVSRRGIQGGYSLARTPREISLVDIISALEGPVALTECSTDVTGLCDVEACCSIKRNQQVINEAIRGVLAKLMLSDLIEPLGLTSIQGLSGSPGPGSHLTGRVQ